MSYHRRSSNSVTLELSILVCISLQVGIHVIVASEMGNVNRLVLEPDLNGFCIVHWSV